MKKFKPFLITAGVVVAVIVGLKLVKSYLPTSIQTYLP